jgi:RNA polymerase sigma-70 factor (ECF subfamily)
MQPADGDDDLARTVRAAQAGDPLAFETLVHRFRGPAAAYAWALLRDRGHAEDAAQEAFVLAHREIRRLRDPGSFRAWLYAIVENLALTGRKRSRRGRTVEIREGEAVAEGRPWREEDPAAGDDAAERPEILAVREALTRIPAAYAQALDMHYVQGLSSREMAAALGVTVNNAKVRLHRARNALRRDLEARGVSGGRAPPAAAPVAEVRP